MESTSKRLCRRSCSHERISDTAANETSTPNSYGDGEVGITNLPTEILEVILENLSFHEISKAREICPRFRDVSNKILNRAVNKLLDRISQHLELLHEADADYLKRFDPDVLRRDSERHRVRRSGTLICRRWLLHVISITVGPLLKVCYRFSLFKDISLPCFFPGKIMDEVHRILTLVRSTRLTIKDMNIDVFFELVETYMDFFHGRIEPTLIGIEAIINSSTLFGSKVFDILHTCVASEKNVKVSEDSQGWYHIRGEYKFEKLYFTCLSSKNFEFHDMDPLTVKEQRILHDCLYSIFNKKNEWGLRQRQMNYKNERPDDPELRVTEGCYEGLAVCDDSVFYYGYYPSRYFYGRYVEWRETDDDDDAVSGENEIYHVDDQGQIFLIGDEQDEEIDYDDADDADEDEEEIAVSDHSIFSHLTIKVEMKCRKELAPIQFIIQEMNSSVVQHEYESSIEDTDHDLVLRLEICCPLAARNNNRLPLVYRCLIKEKEISLVEYMSNPATSQIELAGTPSDNYNRADIFTVRNSLRVAKLIF